MKDYSEKEYELVQKILKASTNTSPVVMSFGYTKDNFCENSLLIKKCSSTIIELLIGEGCILTLDEDGIKVTAIKW